eukprot:911052-Prymnesium_polylepis.1
MSASYGGHQGRCQKTNCGPGEATASTSSGQAPTERSPTANFGTAAEQPVSGCCPVPWGLSQPAIRRASCASSQGYLANRAAACFGRFQSSRSHHAVFS